MVMSSDGAESIFLKCSIDLRLIFVRDVSESVIIKIITGHR